MILIVVLIVVVVCVVLIKPSNISNSSINDNNANIRNDTNNNNNSTTSANKSTTNTGGKNWAGANTDFLFALNDADQDDVISHFKESNVRQHIKQNEAINNIINSPSSSRSCDT